MRKLARSYLLACLLLAACEPTPPPASQQEKDTVVIAYVRCLTKAASEFDDHMSDASTVATVVARRCHTEYMISGEVWGRQLNARARDMYEELRSRGEKDTAIKVVLSERARLLGRR